MERTKITVGYTHTHNLGDYSNARPSIMIEAVLSEGDDPEAVKMTLHDEAVAYVHEAIDQALEASNQPARYSSAPRYTVMATRAVTVGDWSQRVKHTPPEPLVAVVPDAQARILRPADTTTFWHTVRTGLREVHALREASTWVAEHPGARIVACLDGDLTRLPLWALEAIPQPTPTPTPENVGPMFGDDPDDGDYDGEDNSE